MAITGGPGFRETGMSTAATEALPLSSKGGRRRAGFYRSHGKRLFDFMAAGIGLIALACPMVLIGLALCLSEGFPVLFRQTRVGRHLRLFTLYKYRTMSNGQEPGPTITAASDTRITTIGRSLRRYKLDELPQLWNVLMGDMALVGPRPDVPGYLDRLEGEARALWELRPGITGPATLLFRREEEMLMAVENSSRFNDEVIYPEKVAVNLAYLNKYSFATDLGYVLATLAPSLANRLGINDRLGLHYEQFESRIAAIHSKPAS